MPYCRAIALLALVAVCHQIPVRAQAPAPILAPGSPGPRCTIKVAEMTDDLAVFEVFIPPADARRKAVVHKVIDDTGTIVATEKFGTANGHYKVAMIGSYYPGRSYTFVIDGRYEFKFTFNPTS
jgi:hypothetical protein